MPAELAGTSLQCPRCHLLNDIPRLGEVHHFADDGTYVVDESAAPAQAPVAPALHSLVQVYTKANVDAAGQSLDLRGTVGDASKLGDVEKVEEARRRERPRYDPETGELITPLEFVPPTAAQVPPSQIPYARPLESPEPGKTLGYAVRDTPRAVRSTSVAAALLKPENIAVMLFVLVMHLPLPFLGGMLFLKILLIAPLALGLALAIVAHYGCVVEEIATEERDELARVLRDVRFREDIFLPLFSFFLTMAICFGPAIIVFCLDIPWTTSVPISAGLFICGTYIVPATYLTLLTSGSLFNLRPDRVQGVIRVAGARYIGIVLLMIGAGGLYLLAQLAIQIDILRLFDIHTRIPHVFTATILWVPILALAIYLMHVWCWKLALVYRNGRDRFPWVFRHDLTPKRPPVERRKPNYVAPRGAR